MQQTNQSTQSNFTHQPTMSLQPVAIMDEVNNSIKQLIASLPYHPDNPTGHTAYNTQISQWNA
jgi:hypothetical protein